MTLTQTSLTQLRGDLTLAPSGQERSTMTLNFPGGALRNHPYTTGDGPGALLWIKGTHHITSGHLLPQELANHLRVSLG